MGQMVFGDPCGVIRHHRHGAVTEAEFPGESHFGIGGHAHEVAAEAVIHFDFRRCFKAGAFGADIGAAVMGGTGNLFGRFHVSRADVGAIRFRHIRMDDAVFAAVKESALTALREFQILIGENEIPRRHFLIQGAHRRRGQNAINTQFFETPDVGAVIDHVRRNGMTFPVTVHKKNGPSVIFPFHRRDGAVGGFLSDFFPIVENGGIVNAGPADNRNFTHRMVPPYSCFSPLSNNAVAKDEASKSCRSSTCSPTPTK